MKRLLLLCAFCFGFSSLFAQSTADSITVTQKNGTVFSRHGKTLRPAELLDLTINNSAAYQEMQAAKTNHDVAWVLSFASGAVIGWTLTDFIREGTTDWGLLGAGAGLLVLSIPFSSGYTKRANNAVRLYNSSLPQATLRPADVKLGFKGNGIGLNIRF